MSGPRAVLSGAAMLLLSACAPMIWDKEGATQQDYNQDHYACEKDARQSGYFGTGIAGAINMRDFFKECMVAHGWTLRGQGAASSDISPSNAVGAVVPSSGTAVPSSGTDTAGMH
jgi:hypothetical protein